MTLTELGPEDSVAIAELIAAIETADGAPLRTSAAEVAGFFDDSMVWRAIGLWDKEGGRLEAFGLARMPRSGGRARISGGVHPDARGVGLGRLITDAQISEARKIGASGAIVQVDSSNAELVELLKERGFSFEEEFVQLRKPVSDFPVFEVPSHIRIETLGADHDPSIVSFRNAFGAESISVDLWRSEHSFIDREWSRVALDLRGDRPRVVAYVVCERYEDEWEQLGWSEAYIAEVALGEEFRGANLISAMLSETIGSLRAEGIDYVGLDMHEKDYLLETFIDRGFETTGITSVHTLDF